MLAQRIRLLLFASPAAHSVARRIVQVARYLLRRAHEPDFAAFRGFAARDGIFLDIGANAGTSAMSFRLYDRRRPILSIEPNAMLEPDLRFIARIIPRFQYMIGAAGARNGRETLFVPVYRGVAITGAASLDRDVVADHSALRKMLGDRVDSPGFEIVAQPVPVHRLDDLELHPAFVKIDVEGEELAVVQGLARTIARHRPILLVEYARHHAAIAALLDEHGYAAFTYLPEADRLVPREQRRAQNVFFLPPDAQAA